MDVEDLVDDPALRAFVARRLVVTPPFDIPLPRTGSSTRAVANALAVVVDAHGEVRDRTRDGEGFVGCLDGTVGLRLMLPAALSGMPSDTTLEVCFGRGAIDLTGLRLVGSLQSGTVLGNKTEARRGGPSMVFSADIEWITAIRRKQLKKLGRVWMEQIEIHGEGVNRFLVAVQADGIKTMAGTSMHKSRDQAHAYEVLNDWLIERLRKRGSDVRPRRMETRDGPVTVIREPGLIT